MTTPSKDTAKKAAPKAVTPEQVLSEDQADSFADAVEPDAAIPDEIADNVPAPLHERVTAALKDQGLDAVTIEYHGEKFVFPATFDDIDADSFELITRDAIATLGILLPLLLDPEQPGYGSPTSQIGVEQWALFRSMRPRRPQYRELFEAWRSKALDGLSAGE